MPYFYFHTLHSDRAVPDFGGLFLDDEVAAVAEARRGFDKLDQERSRDLKAGILGVSVQAGDGRTIFFASLDHQASEALGLEPPRGAL